MQFNYNWTLKDAIFTKDKGTVFSCFACGGGSTMGYKLAGFDVIGCNEIDPKMMAAYVENHKPKYSFLEPIQTFKDRDDLPSELYNLDILDGSPPCSSFSMVGNREKDWGKKKKFREGQQKQVLDNLFFDFIDLAKKLQPKIVVAENVKGLLMGRAKEYVRKICREFDKAGYYCQHWLLDASKMGVPQRRERVFFICLRKDLAKPFLVQKDLFSIVPKLELEFNEKEIPFCNISQIDEEFKNTEWVNLWKKIKEGSNLSVFLGYGFGTVKIENKKVMPTIIANQRINSFKSSGLLHPTQCRKLNKKELCLGGTFPLDYNFQTNSKSKNFAGYLIGMSVPPVMVAQIANQIFIQWLSKI
jgi:DNA (cytosine-5)-methyltransferase 1